MKEKNKAKSEPSRLVKILRFIVICISIIGLGYYIMQSYIKLKITPEILINEKYVRPSEIPFPAVTICPPQIVSSKFMNVKKVQEKIDRGYEPSLEDRLIMVAGAHVCGIHSKYAMKLKDYKTLNESVVEILSKISPRINESLDQCLISDNNECDDIFIRSLTYAGFCFTFNLLGHNSLFHKEISSDFDVYKLSNQNDNVSNNEEKWTLEDGYMSKEAFINPLRCTEAEFLQVAAKSNKKEFDNFCTGRLESYRVIIHLPNEIPTHIHTYTYIEFKKHKHLRITAAVKNIDDSLGVFPMDYRNCYFKGEKPLRFFKTYTMSNCEQECMANFTLIKCGCVMFSAPRSNDMKVCRFSDAECFSYAYNKWPSSYYKNRKGSEMTTDFPCECMPSCTEIKYNILTDHSFDKMNFDGANETKARIKISFIGGQIVQTTNYVTYQLQNFICDIGGLAGLFLGFSLLSIFEITLNVYEYIKKYFKSIHSKNNMQDEHARTLNHQTVLELSFLNEQSDQTAACENYKLFTLSSSKQMRQIEKIYEN